MPFGTIELREPDWATPQIKADYGLWIPKGLKVQWSSHRLDSGEPGVGVGTGNFTHTAEAMARLANGESTHEDMMMLWFNRSQLNEAIKLMRRARVGVYGADE